MRDLEKRDKEIKKKIKDMSLVAGSDEAGAGCLAGSLFVACVILDEKKPINGLMDSKKLTEKRRESLYFEIIEKAISYSIVEILPKEIDKINILQARMKGFKLAAEGLSEVNHVLVDGNRLPKDCKVSMDYVIKGDDKFKEIAAASILAKYSKDQEMHKLDKIYPNYGFSSHKSYGTKAHKEALNKFGPCPIHRKSYKPVKDSLKEI